MPEHQAEPALPDSLPAPSSTLPPPDLSAARVLIEDVYPEIDAGRYPAKREVGDLFQVWADILMDGHDLIQAVLRYAAPGSDDWAETPMAFHDNDRWQGRFELQEIGLYRYTIEAWHDVFGTWTRDTEKKHAAGQAIGLELIEGRQLVEAALERADDRARGFLEGHLAKLDRAGDDEARRVLMMDPDLRLVMAKTPDRSSAARYARTLRVRVDRIEARFAAWYEMFPRSQGTHPGRGATFRDCLRRLPEIRDLGFDVVYFVPIHPIGEANRKGRNNSVTAQPGEPGSPYAIADHRKTHPELGTLADFRELVAAAHALDMEIALDFAIQAAPDHPWIREHPQWFTFRPDGTIKYAENPPKKYQDIVNVDFYGADAPALWQELRDIVLFWVEQGVKIFRVDNPHTKPIPFWEWMIGSVQRDHPDVIFLSEAFTRPKMMKLLAKAGFTQSYTYFTWRNTKAELTEYLTELSQGWQREYFRPNFFPTTPDILPPYLQTGGRAGFMIRFALAATLSPVYGIYNGFELCEAAALPGREEYADSEKYEFKVWDWDRPGNIKDFIRQVNRIRHRNPALHHLKTLSFHPSDSDQILFYAKISEDRHNAVFIAVNLDPHNAHEAHVEMPLDLLGLAHDQPYRLEDLLLGHSWKWTGSRQHLRLDPASNPVAIFRVSDPLPHA